MQLCELDCINVTISLQGVIMDRLEIEERICESAKVIATWPNPMAALRYRTSMPEVVRNEADWLAYNTEGTRDNLHVKFTPDSQQHQQAMDVLDWLNYCAKRYKPAAKPVIKAIVMMYCMNMNASQYGFRELSKELRGRGVKMGKDTVRRRYNQAMMDLEFAFKRNISFKNYLKGK